MVALAAPAAEVRLELVERFGAAHPEQVVEFELALPLAAGDWSASEMMACPGPAVWTGARGGRRQLAAAGTTRTLALTRCRRTAVRAGSVGSDQWAGRVARENSNSRRSKAGS